MQSIRREEALSEVIGFILILALIAALASVYLTYVVPAQGREGEIKHMAGINDQFLGFKTGVDSLWINGQTNVPISRTFTLGTLTGVTQGSFVVPLFQPYASGGMMVVNGRGESITISADALAVGFPGNNTYDSSPIYYNPDSLYLQILTTNVTKGGGVVISPGNGDWYITLNITRFINPTPSTAPGVLPTVTTSGGSANRITQIQTWINTILVPWSENVNSTYSTTSALTMTLVKNNNATFTNLVIATNVQNNRLYTINLVDDAYGLSPALTFPFEIEKPLDNSTSPWIVTYYPVNIGYIPLAVNESHLLGSLEYQSGNNYWIQQDYYYQAGGVFLSQPGDQASVAKVLPLISVQDTTGIPCVRIVDVAINGGGNIGGTSPVQVISTLNSVIDNRIGNSLLASGTANSRNVTVRIQAQDNQAAQMWNQTFANIKRISGGQSYITNTQAGNTATLTIDPNPSSTEYDLIFDYTRVNLTVELQPVAL
jgi:hypothetical protein